MKPAISFVFMLLTFSGSATTTYRGYVSGKVNETNCDTYGFFGPSQTFDEKLFFGLDQQSGQQIFWTNQGDVFETSANNKYIASVSITAAGEESFLAEIQLFKTSPKSKSASVTAILSNQISEYTFSGILNAKNEYEFIDDQEHDFFLKIEIDKNFTLEEKQARLLKKLAGQTGE